MSYLLLNFEFFLSFLSFLSFIWFLVELELELVEFDFGVAVKAHHGAVIFVACVVECEVGAVVQPFLTDSAKTKLVLVPSFFFVLLLILVL
jgi:hypothetical protein